MRAYFILVNCALLVHAVVPQPVNAQSDLKSQIAWALSAAPPSIAAGAAVVTMSEDGKFKSLRNGENGWTCMVHDPGTPMGHPLCVDRNGLDWMATAMSGHAPHPDKVGYSYMLRGGSTWSNTDALATKPDQGLKDFIRIPPHVMIMNARIANLSGFPSGEIKPDTSKPFVMYGGTPYAIVIMPLK